MKTKISFFALAIVLIALASCQKDQDITPSTPSSSEEMVTPNPADTCNMQLKISSSSILNASNASQIPSAYFGSASDYKRYYTHMHQPDNTSCSWTSYVLCAAAIVNGSWRIYSMYPVTRSKVYVVKEYCDNSTDIDDVKLYPMEVENFYFNGVYRLRQSKNSTGRFTAIKQMINHLYVYRKPFIAIITRSNIGHYVVVWDIDWKCGGGGSTVYYTDPHDNPTGSWSTQKQSMSLTSFLDKMGPLNTYTNNYCALMLR